MFAEIALSLSMRPRNVLCLGLYISPSNHAKDQLFFTLLLEVMQRELLDVGVRFPNDSEGAFQFVTSPTGTSHTRQIDVRYKYSREVKQGEIIMVRMSDNTLIPDQNVGPEACSKHLRLLLNDK